MSEYQLSPDALQDLDLILSYLQRHRGESFASDVQFQLTDAFHRLALTPGLGHRRQELTSRPVHFYQVKPYLVVYSRQTDPLAILRILHSARDVRHLLRSRPR